MNDWKVIGALPSFCGFCQKRTDFLVQLKNAENNYVFALDNKPLSEQVLRAICAERLKDHTVRLGAQLITTALRNGKGVAYGTETIMVCSWEEPSQLRVIALTLRLVESGEARFFGKRKEAVA